MNLHEKDKFHIENELLQKKFDIAVNALEYALKDYEFNGPCENEEGCSGHYMADIIQKALKEIDLVGYQ